jgi:protein-tyrosine phosphatase
MTPGCLGEQRLDCLVNLRDLGGLPLRGGGVTREGVLYRSDAPYPGDTDPRGVGVWPPAAVVDLRSEGEIARGGDAWSDLGGVVRHHRPIHGVAVPESMRAGTDLGAMYRFMIDAVPERIAAAFTTVAESGDGPVLVHCTAGKDRTGIVVAALLLAVGVEPDAVVADYCVTGENLDAVERRWLDKGVRTSTSRPLPAHWSRTPAEAAVAVIDRFEAHADGIVGWLTTHGATRSQIVTWQRRMTDRQD